ncbi:LacI family transcriptional regulator [Burkholderia aenigmatica]|uniref:LacI family transcriptional regulator n=1 Tax=Burkholderia aenigmatica TaxID=2015348 RepID=A0A6P2H1L5_9BURK|nr:LacI family DNA-binding transcriptional regulator [Burkholderia aenigmatica]VWB10884.1 LacI family transcriptional regulator [Burkholderia aenigmatica]
MKSRKTDSTRRPLATSQDVARLAGVSQSTVSRALAEHASVSEETRSKVRDAAAALGYRPNVLARSLITQRSGLIAIVVASMDNPFYWEVLGLFSQALQASGQQLLLFTIGPHENFDSVIRKVLQYRVDGVIVVAAALSSQAIAECRDANLPVVLFNRYVDGSNLNAVVCDNVEGGRAVATLLANTGHRTFGFISGVEDTSTNRDRLDGFRQQLRALDLPMPAVEHGDYTYEGGREAVKRLVLQGERPDAIFCANDIMAIGALDGLRLDLGLRVPEDISLIGFDDIPMASWSGVELTTVRQQRARMVEASLQILRQNLVSPGMDPVFHLEPGRLILRRTVRLKAGRHDEATAPAHDARP